MMRHLMLLVLLLSAGLAGATPVRAEDLSNLSVNPVEEVAARPTAAGNPTAAQSAAFTDIGNPATEPALAAASDAPASVNQPPGNPGASVGRARERTPWEIWLTGTSVAILL